MTLNLQEALAKLREKTFDPEEFVMFGDYKMRASDIAYVAVKQLRDQDYKGKNRGKLADYQKEYRTNNPEIIDAQKRRAGDSRRLMPPPRTTVEAEAVSSRK